METAEGSTTATPARVPLAAGTRINGYEIRGALGRGAFALTYAAVDCESGRDVLVKECFPRGVAVRDRRSAAVIAASEADPANFTEAVEAIRREASILSTLDAPGVARLLATIDANETVYLVLERIEGSTLADVLRHRGLGADEAAGLLLALLDTVAEVHDAGVLHRDIKPANVIISADGRAVLTDFSAARPMAIAEQPTLRTSDLTPGYAAPEQYGPEEAEGPWTDIYAVAAIGYEIVADAPPPDASTRHTGRMTPAVEVGAGRYPEGFLRAVDAALDLDPRDRLRSAEVFQTELLSGIDEDDDLPPTVRIQRASEPVSPPSKPKRARERAAQSSSRRPILWGLIAMAVLVVAGVGGWPLYEDWSRDVWTVDATGGGDVQTISEAIARARSGATVRIRPGTYAENLRLADPLDLVGVGDSPADVVVAPAGGSCLVAMAEAGTIKGMTLKGAVGDGPGAPCLDLAHGRVLVEGNVVTGGSGPGLRLRDGAEATVRGNRFVAVGGPAILVESSARGTVTDNVIEDTARAGIIVRGGAVPVIAANAIRHSGQAGVLFAAGGGGRLANNVIAEARASGVEVRDGADPEVVGNRISAATEAGVYVYDGGAGRFSDNVITGNTYSGVVIGPGGDPELTGNRITDNTRHGVLALDAAQGRLDDNTIAGNEGHGIALGLDAETAFGENAVTGNADPQVQTGEAPKP